MLSTLYAAIARRRREWYAARPRRAAAAAASGHQHRQHRRRRARARRRSRRRSRGCSSTWGRGRRFSAAATRRTDPVDGAVVVRDARGLRADLARSGDEPFMLARQLDGAIVIVGRGSVSQRAPRRTSPRRDGSPAGRWVSALRTRPRPRHRPRVAPRTSMARTTLPAGRLREPPDVLIAADAIVCVDGEDDDQRSRHPGLSSRRGR